MKIKRYDKFNEESGYIKSILLSALVSIGINKMQAQEIKDQKKLCIISTIIDYNKYPKGVNDLKINLSDKVEDPDKFIEDFLRIEKDKTIIVKTKFITGLGIKYNPLLKNLGIEYNIKF